MTEVVFVGTGEAVDPELPNTSLLFRGARTVLCDCGYSVPQALWRVTRDPDHLDAVFISHGHADHLFGLPGLLLWLREAGRRRPLVLLASRTTQAEIAAAIELAYPGLLGALGELVERRTVTPGTPLSLGPVGLSVAQSDHAAENLALRLEDEGRSVCFSGDGRPNAATLELFSGASLLVHECYHLEPGSLGHANLAELVDASQRAGVGQLALVHLGRASAAAIRARATALAGVLLPAVGQVLRL